MAEARNPSPPLTDEQAARVRENLGLVSVHLRRNVRELALPRYGREWEDLFQEGCLGLMQAAIRYRPKRNIPFAAFALPRIRRAISRALLDKVPAMRPPQLGGDGRHQAEVTDLAARVESATIGSRLDTLEGRRLERRAVVPTRATIGECLRSKYERAVRNAEQTLAGQMSPRGDRTRLMRVLIEERFLVPHEESRRGLRQIARDTRSSYARVARCDKQLSEAIRGVLARDPELPVLRRRARADPLGIDVPVDECLEQAMTTAGADEIVRRFRESAPEERVRFLHAFLEVSKSDIESDLRGRFAGLSPPVRERWLDLTFPTTEKPRRSRKPRRTSPHSRASCRRRDPAKADRAPRCRQY